MKRSILSLLLILALLVSVSVFAVEATTVTPITYDQAVATAGGEGGTLNFWCEACQDNVDWTPAAVVSKKFTPATGHGYVPSTSSLSDTSTVLKPSNFANVNAKLCLYLKGDVLYTGTTRMFQLYTTSADAVAAGADRSQLNIMGTGTIKSTGAMSSGTTALITATTNTSTNFNEFVMYGGTIDCTEGSNSAGATVFFANGTTTTAKTRTDRFVMKGGTIKGGSSEGFGGTLYLKYTCDFEMTGGEIIGGTTTGQAGGVLYMSESTTDGALEHTFTMTGGTIRDGKVEHAVADKNAMGGNLYFEGVDVTISGDAKIKDGKAESSAANARGGNIYITGTCDLDISGNAEISGGHAIITKSSTSLYAQGGNILLQSNVTATISGGIIKDGHTTVKGNSENIGGNLLTYGNVTMSGGTIQDGYTYRSSNNSYTSDKNRGGNIYVGGKTFTMTGGTIQTTEDFAHGTRQCNRGGNVYVAAAFELTGKDAVIKDGRATRGGNIAVASGKTLTVSNGTISGGAAGYGFGVFVEGTATISGGSVADGMENGVYVENKKLTTVETGEEAITTGKLIITDGFTGKLYVHSSCSASSSDTTTAEVAEVFMVDNKLNSNLIVADGYVNGGVVAAQVDDEYYPVFGSGTEFVVAEAALFDGKHVLAGGTLAEMVAAYTANPGVLDAINYIKLFNAEGATVTVPENAYLDVNGNDVTLANGRVKLMDSATNDYDDTDAAKVTLSQAEAVDADAPLCMDGVYGQRRYAVIENEDGTVSAHRFYITQRNVGVRVEEDDLCPDLIFSGTFRGTQTFAENVEEFGIRFYDESWNTLKEVAYNEKGQTFTGGNLIYGKNINITCDEAQAAEYGEKVMSGMPYITLKGNKEYSAMTVYPTSVKDQVEHFGDDYANLTANEQAIYDAMVERSAALFDTLGWNYRKETAA